MPVVRSEMEQVHLEASSHILLLNVVDHGREAVPDAKKSAAIANVVNATVNLQDGFLVRVHKSIM